MKLKKLFFVIMLVLCVLCCACGKEENEDTEAPVILNGDVDSSQDFVSIGLLIDVNQDDGMITNVSYKIEEKDIAVVSFKYNGIECELRGSTVYREYELLQKENTSTGNMLVTSVNGYSATYYTLNPGRAVFWEDTNIYYALYTYVTADDSVLDSILTYLIFENHYYEKIDVVESTDEESKVFAEKIATAIVNKDIDTLSEMMYYPQQLGNGQSVGNVNELLNIPEEDLFTDGIIKAMADNAVDGMRINDDGDYVIGTNYKNIRFRHMDDGSFLIMKINN
jgi:hypothetical protein